MEDNKLEKIQKSLSDLKNKHSKIYFFLPSVREPNSSTYEIFFHANTLMKDGFEVTLIADSEEFTKPFYIDKELFENIKFEIVENARMTLGPEDILVIPDVLTNVMEQTKNLPSIRIVFHQSLDYMYNALMLMTSYTSHGMENVITNSNDMKEYLRRTIGGTAMDIQTYQIGIPDYFKPDVKPKQPTICFISRNANDITKVVKDFYSKHPMYSFITFESMYSDSKPPRQLTRKEFAEKLGRSIAAIWVDRISSFGTFPLECMKSETIPIGLIPDFTPPFLFDEAGKPLNNAGVWSSSTYELSDLLGKVISMFIDDTLPKEVFETMEKVVAKYNVEDSRKSILECYNHYISNRISMLENAVEKLQKKEPETV